MGGTYLDAGWCYEGYSSIMAFTLLSHHYSPTMVSKDRGE